MNARSTPAALTAAQTPVIGQTFATIVYAATRNARKVARALVNRRVARRLEEFSDSELADIGLTRDDIGCGLSLPLSADPTLEYARRARFNSGLSRL